MHIIQIQIQKNIEHPLYEITEYAFKSVWLHLNISPKSIRAVKYSMWTIINIDINTFEGFMCKKEINNIGLFQEI